MKVVLIYDKDTGEIKQAAIYNPDRPEDDSSVTKRMREIVKKPEYSNCKVLDNIDVLSNGAPRRDEWMVDLDKKELKPIDASLDAKNKKVKEMNDEIGRYQRDLLIKEMKVDGRWKAEWNGLEDQRAVSRIN
jgi:hypothetical protein